MANVGTKKKKNSFRLVGNYRQTAAVRDAPIQISKSKNKFIRSSTSRVNGFQTEPTIFTTPQLGIHRRHYRVIISYTINIIIIIILNSSCSIICKLTRC